MARAATPAIAADQRYQPSGPLAAAKGSCWEARAAHKDGGGGDPTLQSCVSFVRIWLTAAGSCDAVTPVGGSLCCTAAGAPNPVFLVYKTASGRPFSSLPPVASESRREIREGEVLVVPRPDPVALCPDLVLLAASRI